MGFSVLYGSVHVVSPVVALYEPETCTGRDLSGSAAMAVARALPGMGRTQPSR